MTIQYSALPEQLRTGETLNKINALRPKSIIETIGKDFFVIEPTERYKGFIHDGKCYESYYAVGKYYQPKSILEIGVRLGWSLGSLISGSDECDIATGIDWIEPNYQTIWEKTFPGKYIGDVIAENFKKIRPNLEFKFIEENSQKINQLDRNYDLIHIDGTHEIYACYKDLNLAKMYTKTIIVDDVCWGHDSVKVACDKFVKENEYIIKEYFIVDHGRGLGIIQLK